MITAEEKMIDGARFVVTKLPAMRGFRTLNRLMRALGPALAAAAGAAGGLMEMNLGQLGSAVELLFEKLSDDEQEHLTRELLYAASANGKPLFGAEGCFDDEFAGKHDTLLKLIVFAIEVNYGSFTNALRRSIAGAPQAQGTPSSSPST